jgi:hypothetical protein
MSETTSQIPESLRQSIAEEMEPVCPLSAPWKRILWVVPLAVLAFFLPVGILGTRPDLDQLGVILAWLPVLVQLLLGIGFLAMALHEAVPGRCVSRGAVAALIVAALVLHGSVNAAIWWLYPVPAENTLSLWWMCFRHELILGIPFLIVATWLAVRALPICARTVGLVSGVGGGVMADATWRMICPVSQPSHVLSAHLGPIVFLGAIGFLLGWAWERAHRL